MEMARWWAFAFTLYAMLGSSWALTISSDDDVSRRQFLSWGSAALASASACGIELNNPQAAAAAVTQGPIRTQAFDSQQPFSSVRRYKTVTLQPNRLKVLLVSDKQAIRSAAAITVQGAGQFADPIDLPGLAHLTEHMILSYNSKSTFRQSRDFEDWLSDRAEGASNAFTAYEKVCFHFSCQTDFFGEAMERFAGLFLQQNLEQVCGNSDILKREIRRVDSELDFSSSSTQTYYLIKDFVNIEHPYSRFSAGNIDTLERLPKELGLNVGEKVVEFFQSKYQPEKAVLVITGPQDLFALERMVAPFAKALSNVKLPRTTKAQIYPGSFLKGKRLKRVVLHRSQDEQNEKISFDFATNLDYRERTQSTKFTATASQIGFVLSQVFGRRGPGSLYLFLLRRGWIPVGSNTLPRVTVPLDVSGFQIVRLDIPLTVDGFANRSAIVAAVYNLLAAIQSKNVLSRALLSQYAVIAKLNGYTFASRPPDAVELAVDAQDFGLQGAPGIAKGEWYRFPDEKADIDALQRETLRVLREMTDIENVVIVATAGSNALSRPGFIDDTLPPLSSTRWLMEPISGGVFCYDDMLKFASQVELFFLRKVVDEDEIQLPVLNPLVPTFLRPARIKPSENLVNASRKHPEGWSILYRTAEQPNFPLPRGPPEPTSRCVLVVELLSPRPARASIRQAAQAELWRISFESAVSDLAELGAPACLAYDVSFNRFGLRLAFIGISQTLPSYVRRLCRRIVDHHFNLLDGKEIFSEDITKRAMTDAKSIRGISQIRRRRYISNLRRSTAYEAATEGLQFLRSCTGGVCFYNGDLLPQEVDELILDLNTIFAAYITNNTSRTYFSMLPAITDLLYRPQWQPRSGSPCALPGASLLNDACGRIPR